MARLNEGEKSLESGSPSHLLGRVIVRKVRARQLSLGGGDLVLAAALLAVVLVVVQDKA